MVAQTLSGNVLTCAETDTKNPRQRRDETSAPGESPAAYTFDCLGSGAVLEHNAQFWELAVNLKQMREETNLGIQHAAALQVHQNTGTHQRQREP
jgi:hypothetical protein